MLAGAEPRRQGLGGEVSSRGSTGVAQGQPDGASHARSLSRGAPPPQLRGWHALLRVAGQREAGALVVWRRQQHHRPGHKQQSVLTPRPPAHLHWPLPSAVRPARELPAVALMRSVPEGPGQATVPVQAQPRAGLYQKAGQQQDPGPGKWGDLPVTSLTPQGPSLPGQLLVGAAGLAFKLAPSSLQPFLAACQSLCVLWKTRQRKQTWSCWATRTLGIKKMSGKRRGCYLSPLKQAGSSLEVGLDRSL